MKNNTLKIGLLSLTSLIVTNFASGSVITFGNATLGGTTNSISGSSITYTSTLIFGGTATGANHRTDAGNVSGTLGTFGGHNNTFFGSTNLTGSSTGTPAYITTDGINSTLIGIGPNTAPGGLDDVDNGLNTGFADYIGLHLSFSSSISLSAFGSYDIDGATDRGQNEWNAAFAYNSLTATTVTPTITLGTAANPLVQTPNNAVNWAGITGAPSNYEVVYNNTTTNNLGAPDEEGQVSYDFSGATVTDIYILHGIAADRENVTNPQGTSTLTGLTGITLIVPEPSSALLLGIGCFATFLRRKR